ncbi:MAG: heme-copper oxidase subunit III [Owenweeksia sp.]|nr:heme-copper oxidase subunit III [Owenweeksia sp.]
MGSIVMTFAGLTSGYVVSRSALSAEDAWLQFLLPIHFYYATAIIIAASLSMIAAWLAIRKNNQSGLVIWLAVSLILGVSFAVMQYLGWQDLIDRSLFFTGKGSSTAASWVYVITFLHWLHVISGIIVLAVTLFQAMREACNERAIWVLAWPPYSGTSSVYFGYICFAFWFLLDNRTKLAKNLNDG